MEMRGFKEERNWTFFSFSNVSSKGWLVLKGNPLSSRIVLPCRLYFFISSFSFVLFFFVKVCFSLFDSLLSLLFLVSFEYVSLNAKTSHLLFLLYRSLHSSFTFNLHVIYAYKRAFSTTFTFLHFCFVLLATLPLPSLSLSFLPHPRIW